MNSLYPSIDTNHALYNSNLNPLLKIDSAQNMRTATTPIVANPTACPQRYKILLLLSIFILGILIPFIVVVIVIISIIVITVVIIIIAIIITIIIIIGIITIILIIIIRLIVVVAVIVVFTFTGTVCTNYI